METDKFWFSFEYVEIEALSRHPNREIEKTLPRVDMSLREEI